MLVLGALVITIALYGSFFVTLPSYETNEPNELAKLTVDTVLSRKRIRQRSVQISKVTPVTARTFLLIVGSLIRALLLGLFMFLLGKEWLTWVNTIPGYWGIIIAVLLSLMTFHGWNRVVQRFQSWLYTVSQYWHQRAMQTKLTDL